LRSTGARTDYHSALDLARAGGIEFHNKNFFRPIITVRPKKSLKAAGQSIFLSKHPLHVDQLYGVFDTKKNGEII
jgi:hypothetical protein